MIQTSYAADLGHIDDADALYRAYLSRYPDDWSMLSDYARLLRKHGRAPEAITQYKEILRVAPDKAKTYLEMATAYRTLSLVPEALTAYAEAFRLDPQQITAGDTAREYGFLLVQNGEEQKAEQLFSGLLEKRETRERGMRSLALIDSYHGRFASARKRFDECLTILQNQQAALSKARVHLLLAIVAEGQGDVAMERRELDASFDNFAALGPKVIIGAWIGGQYLRAGELDKAVKIESIIAPFDRQQECRTARLLATLARRDCACLGKMQTRQSNCSPFQTQRTALRLALKLWQAPINRPAKWTRPLPGTKSSWVSNTGQSSGRLSSCGWRLMLGLRPITLPRATAKKLNRPSAAFLTCGRTPTQIYSS